MKTILRRFEEQMKETLAERERQASIRLQEMKEAAEQRERDWRQLKDDMQMSNMTGAEELKHEYQRRLKEKTEENERALERASWQATQTKNQTDADIKRLQHECAAQQTAFFKLESETKRLTADKSKLSEDVERLTARGAALSAELEDSKREMKELRSQATHFESNNQRLEREMKESTRALLSNQDENVKQEVATLQRQRDQLTVRLNETTKLLQESQELQQTLVDQMTKSSSDADDVRTELLRMQGQLANKDNELEALRSDKSVLETQIGLSSQVLDRRSADFTETASALEARLTTSEEENKRLAAELKDANMLMTQYSNQTAESTNSIKSMQDRLREAELALGGANELRQEELLKLSTEKDRAVTKLEEEIALMSSSMENLETSFQSAILKADMAQEESTGLKNAMRDMQLQLDQTSCLHNDAQSLHATLRQQMASLEKENSTLTDEMDKILQENASLRQELDDTQVQLDDITSQNQDLQEQNQLLLVGPQLLGQTGTAPQRSSQSFSPTSSGNARGHFFPGSNWAGSPRRTCGVHTCRLLRIAFNEWMTACEDRRMTGLNPAFSCLGQLTNTDGSIATTWPVARIRRENLEINMERIGSGSFAEVFKGKDFVHVTNTHTHVRKCTHAECQSDVGCFCDSCRPVWVDLMHVFEYVWCMAGELKIKCAVKKIRVVPLPQASRTCSISRHLNAIVFSDR